MNINPKDRKNYHGLTVEEKKELFSTIHSVIQSVATDYQRMYTEPRMYGYRCKLWLGQMTDKQGLELATNLQSALKNSSVSHYIAEVCFRRTQYVNTRYMYNYTSSSPAFRITFK